MSLIVWTKKMVSVKVTTIETCSQITSSSLDLFDGLNHFISNAAHVASKAIKVVVDETNSVLIYGQAAVTNAMDTFKPYDDFDVGINPDSTFNPKIDCYNCRTVTIVKRKR